jgi:hypothetical protein
MFLANLGTWRKHNLPSIILYLRTPHIPSFKFLISCSWSIREWKYLNFIAFDISKKVLRLFEVQTAGSAPLPNLCQIPVPRHIKRHQRIGPPYTSNAHNNRSSYIGSWTTDQPVNWFHCSASTGGLLYLYGEPPFLPASFVLCCIPHPSCHSFADSTWDLSQIYSWIQDKSFLASRILLLHLNSPLGFPRLAPSTPLWVVKLAHQSLKMTLAVWITLEASLPKLSSGTRIHTEVHLAI